MIRLRKLDHVGLRAEDPVHAAERWALQFGLIIRNRGAGRASLACDDEPCALELMSGEPTGFDHVAWELDRDCSVRQARDHLEALGWPVEQSETGLWLRDADGNRLQLCPYREPVSRLVPQARPGSGAPVGHPRRLGHVNFLTSSIKEQVRFYTEALGMRVTDWLGDEGVWLHINTDHHVMALVRKGHSHLHHLAFEVVDIGQMRDSLDHLGRHGRWLAWGPVRHGIGGNIAAYARIVEEECFVELYCDMEQLQSDHQPRHWPDNRYSSNTWGGLPPRSYFRFDAAAVESERESLEMLGIALPPEQQPAESTGSVQGVAR
jgi:catechol 2,3-dioxygenase-like lactoylglutathione lyase family enzyme